ncbi:MAG: hypothetical protein M0Z56_00375 [Desulfobacteraceae bacterium]|nr:hypothetical protein [Desulfobacteraceae bacterium]
MELTIEDFNQVIEQEPSLSDSGVNSMESIRNFKKMGIEDAKKQLLIDRESFLSNFKEFKVCCSWLSKFKKVKTPQLSSYYLKHVVEKLEGEYVSNGALIAAAIHLKIPMKFYPDSPNVNIAISKICPYLKRSGNV